MKNGTLVILRMMREVLEYVCANVCIDHSPDCIKIEFGFSHQLLHFFDDFFTSSGVF